MDGAQRVVLEHPLEQFLLELRGLVCPFATLVETVQPIQYLVRGQVYPANLTVLVSTLLRGEEPCSNGSGCRQRSFLKLKEFDGHEMVILAC